MDEINSTNSQGFTLSSGADGTDAYTDALNLLSNQDEYDFNLILIPGVIDEIHPSIVTKAIDVCEDRGDCFVIVDPVSSVVLSNLEEEASSDSKADGT